MAIDPDASGPGDLMTPFVFVPHGAPDPVEWKRAHPGWVSFPATFVPHKPAMPKWTTVFRDNQKHVVSDNQRYIRRWQSSGLGWRLSGPKPP